MLAIVAYPGGKNGSGVYQKLINQMPPHTIYIEPFLGGGAVARLKLPAKLNIGIDRDAEALARTSSRILALHPGTDWRFECRSAIPWLEAAAGLGPETLVYCDPPYVLSTRTRRQYRYELEDVDHRRLLRAARRLQCRVMISGYWSELYGEALAGWRTLTFQAMTRGGTLATEWVWMNYEAPAELHDYRYLGTGFRERERIKRKKQRWVARLAKMPELERQCLLSAIDQDNERRRRDGDGRSTIAAVDDATRSARYTAGHGSDDSDRVASAP